MKRALLIGMGSAGDVFPFISLGRALKQRGWGVDLMANPAYLAEVERAGLEFIPLGTLEHHERITRDPNLWHPSRGTRTILADYQAIGLVRRQRDHCLAFAAGAGKRVVVASSLGFGARVAREQARFPLVTAHLAPIVLRCLKKPPRLPGGWLPNILIRLAPTLTYRLVDRVVDRFLAPALEPLRCEIGLPPQRRYLAGWWNSPDGVMLAYPDWLGESPTLPAQARHVGFLQHDDTQSSQDLAPLWRFVEGGSSPVVVTFGSAMRHARWLLERVVRATGKLGRRLVILSRDNGQVPISLPSHAFHANWAPMAELLPRAALLIHHGGAGTLGRALEAGVPQLVLPFAHDQTDNAGRVEALGAGAWISARWTTQNRLEQALRQVLGNPALQAQCRSLAGRIDSRAALEMACDWLETVQARPAD